MANFKFQLLKFKQKLPGGAGGPDGARLMIFLQLGRGQAIR